MPRKISHKGMIRKLDDHFREMIRERDNYHCVWCGTNQGKLEVSHVIPKGRCLFLRWEPKNLKLLCYNCHHHKWHLRAEGRQWFDAEFPDRISYLEANEKKLVKSKNFVKEMYDNIYPQ